MQKQNKSKIDEEENIKQKKSHKKQKKQKKVTEEVEEQSMQVEEQQTPKKKKSMKKETNKVSKKKKAIEKEKEIYDESEEEAHKNEEKQNPKGQQSHHSEQQKGSNQNEQEESNKKSENNSKNSQKKSEQQEQQEQNSKKQDEQEATNKQSQEGQEQQQEQQQEQSQEQSSEQTPKNKKKKSQKQSQSQQAENLQGIKKIDRLFKKMSGKPVTAEQILATYNEMCDIYKTYDIDEDLQSSLIEKVQDRMKSAQPVEEQKSKKKRKKIQEQVVHKISQMDQCALNILKNGKLFMEEKYHNFLTTFGTYYIVQEIQFPRYFLARPADHILNQDLIQLIKKDLESLIDGQTNQKDIFYKEIFKHIQHQNQLSLKGGEKRLRSICRETLKQAFTVEDQIIFIDIPCYPPIYGMMENGTIYVNVNPLSSYHSDELKVIYCMSIILHELPRYALYHLGIKSQEKPSYPPGINDRQSGDIIEERIFGQRIRYVNEKLYKCLQKYNKGQEVDLKKQFASLSKKKLNGICVDRKKDNISYQSKSLMRRTRLRL